MAWPPCQLKVGTLYCDLFDMLTHRNARAEHTLFAMRSARTFLDCGYTMCLGAASAKSRLDAVLRNSIRAGDIPGPRFLANGQEVRDTRT